MNHASSHDQAGYVGGLVAANFCLKSLCLSLVSEEILERK